MPMVMRRFGQQPILKQLDLGKVRRGLRADDPVSPGKPACILERPNEAPADEIPRRKRGASERYSLAVDRGIDNHAGAVQHRPLGRLCVRNAGNLEPPRPRLAIVEVEQGKLQDIRRPDQTVTPRKELGTTDNE